MGIIHLIKKLLSRKSNDENKIFEYKEFERKTVSKSVNDNKEYLKMILKGSQDIIFRDFFVGTAKQHLMLTYVDGMVDKSILNDDVMKSMMIDLNSEVYKEIFSVDEIKSRLLTACEVNEFKTFDKLVLQLLSGDTLMFLEGAKKGLVVGSKGWESRGVSEPTTEKNVKGPKDCFIETLRSNIVLIRRRIRDPNLAIEMYQVGRRTKTDVAVVYLKGVIMDGIPEEIKKRIERIDVDGVVDSSQLEQLIEDNKWTIFPQTVSTERPDRTVAGILEGRAAIIVDGSPFALLVPSTFSMFLDTPDDYYTKPIISSIILMTRYASFFLSASLPGIYIAITNFHPAMLPPRLALSITATRMALPFTTFFEIFMMEAILEILQEAGIRLPQAIGQTVGIVGGIVIGEAAVTAGIVSPIVVIIVTLTAITSFTIPNYNANLASRILRIPFMLAGTTFGLFGIVTLAMFVLTHMASLETFGIGYFEEFSPYRPNSLKETFIRLPKGLTIKRPEFLKPQDSRRQGIKKGKGDD